MAENETQESKSGNFSSTAGETEYAKVEAAAGTNNIPHHFAVESEEEGIRSGRTYYMSGTAAKAA
jgi:hypothetical protein